MASSIVLTREKKPSSSRLLHFVSRFFAGIGVGTVFTGIPMYMGEIAEDRVRGGFGILITVMLNAGYLVSYSIGPWVSTTTLAAVGAAIPILSAIIFAWVPESPYYYAIKNLPQKMEKSLIWLRGTDDVNAELQNIQKTVTMNLNDKGTITEIFTVKGNRKVATLQTMNIRLKSEVISGGSMLI